MLLDNTQAITGFDSKTPVSYLRKTGRMAGLGYSPEDDYGPTAPVANGTQASGGLSVSTLTALNSEALFFTNLARQIAGKAPIDPKTNAPSVNVGVTPATQKLMMGLAIAGGALFLLSRRRR